MDQPLQQPIYVAPNYNPSSGNTGQPNNIYYQQPDTKIVVVQQPVQTVDQNYVIWIILAVFFGGFATLCASCTLPPEKSGTYCCYSIIQILTMGIVIGYVWAIINAVQGYP